MFQIETIIPIIIGGSIGFLALLGILEFVKESSVAIKR